MILGGFHSGFHSVHSEIFARLEQHVQIPDEEKQRLLPLLSKKTFSKGEYFAEGGEVSTYAGYMSRGLVRYFYIDQDGKEYTKYFCQGGNFVSSYASLITGKPSEFFIQALEPTEIILFKYSDWVALTENHCLWAKINKSMMDYALLLADERERSLIMDDASTRYARFLMEFPGIEQKVTLTDIATYLGITLVSLSRIRSKNKKS